MIFFISTSGLSIFADYSVYIFNKQDLYKDYVSPSSISGLAPIILFILIFSSFVVYTSNTRPNNLLILILIFEGLSFLLTKVSYAGLRFQLIFLFALILLIKQEQNIITDKRSFFKFMFFIGLIGFMITMKNITFIDEEAESTYVPYRFFWEEI